MSKLIIVDRGGQAIEIDATAELSIMENIRAAGLDELLALCGGSCSCATCHVYVDQDYLGRLSPISEDEDDLLGSSNYRKSESRLSCQLTFSDSLNGMTIQIAPED